MVVLDTNIIIDHLRQFTTTSLFTKFVDSRPEELRGLSIISVQELYQGKSTLMEDKEQNLLDTIDQLIILSYTFETAQLAGTIIRDANYTISFADAAIAATTIINDAQLFTLNRKDFEGIKGLELIKV